MGERMTTNMTTSPEVEAARKYMAHKGYPDIDPVQVEQVQGESCWYFLYKLPEGLLEVEVDHSGDDWNFTTFWVDE